MNKLLKPTFTALSISVVLSACNLAPKYEQPAVELPAAAFRYNINDRQGIQAAALGWQDYFADPRLHRLIELGLKNNTDMRTANLNVEQVRAQYAITRAAGLPGLSGSGSGSRSGVGNPSSISESYRVGLGITSFELDLWGRVRNTNEAALQSYLSTAAGRDSTQLSLVSTIAKAYFNERYAAEAMALSEQVLQTRQETYRLSQLRHKAGVISALDLRQQEALIESAKSDYAGALKTRDQARNNLELLISQALPDDLPPAQPLSQQFKIRNLPAGLPSDLLLNRPDIIAAEHSLKQQNANIGAARAAFFPTISLTGSAGFQSSQLSDLFQGGSRIWSFGPSVSVPIFDWGSNRASLESAKLAQQKALVAYEAAVESAFRDVSDALVARAAFNSQYDARQAQSKAYRDALRLTRLRYQHGVSSSLDLLDAERSSYGADSSLLATELSMMENLADLYKVLGGGLKRHSQDEAAVRSQIEAANTEAATPNNP